MEQLKERYACLQEMLVGLSELAEDIEMPKSDRDQAMIRDAMIKRFEVSKELFLKYLNRYLTKMHGIVLTMTSPSSAVRKACSIGIMSPEDAEMFLMMMKESAEAMHIHLDADLSRFGSKIPAYYKLMKQYTDKLTPETT